MRADRLGGISQSVRRDVEPGHLGARQQLLQLVEQVRLSTADIEDARVRVQAVVFDEVLGHRFPAAVVAIAAIPVAAVAVPVVEAVLLRLEHAMHFVVGHSRHVVARRSPVQRGDEIQQLSHGSSAAL